MFVSPERDTVFSAAAVTQTSDMSDWPSAAPNLVVARSE